MYHNKAEIDLSKFQWFNFEPDLAIAEVTETLRAGIFSMRLYLHDVSNHGVFDVAKYP